MYIFVILATNIYIYMCVVETLIESMIIYYGYYNEKYNDASIKIKLLKKLLM